MSISRNLSQLSSAYTSGGISSFKNRIINGAMMIDQRNAGAAITNNTGYPVDRFVFAYAADGAASAQRSSIAPPGFSNSLVYTTTTADASLATTQYGGIAHQIEGYNIADLAWGTLNAAPVTLSFWVRSSLTGTFSGALRNNAADKSYVFTYTINAANTWEQKSITIAGETSGSWVIDNGLGIRVWFSMGSGSTYSTSTTGSWTAGNFSAATGTTSIIGTLGATFYITGVQLEKGSTATSFDWRPYGTELALCQRYFENVSFGSTAGGRWTSSDWTGYVSFAVTKRVLPTVAISGTFYTFANASNGATTNVTPWTASNALGLNGLGIRAIGGAADYASCIICQNTGVISASAEL